MPVRLLNNAKWPVIQRHRPIQNQIQNKGVSYEKQCNYLLFQGPYIPIGVYRVSNSFVSLARMSQ